MKIAHILVIENNTDIKESTAYYSSSDVIDHGVNAGKDFFDFVEEKFWAACRKIEPKLRASPSDYTEEEWADEEIGSYLPSFDDGRYGDEKVMVHMLFPDVV